MSTWWAKGPSHWDVYFTYAGHMQTTILLTVTVYAIKKSVQCQRSILVTPLGPCAQTQKNESDPELVKAGLRHHGDQRKYTRERQASELHGMAAVPYQGVCGTRHGSNSHKWVRVSETRVPRSCLGCQHRFESQERETNFKLVLLWTLSEKPAEVRFLQKGSEFNSLHPLGMLQLPVTPALRDPVPSF